MISEGDKKIARFLRPCEVVTAVGTYAEAMVQAINAGKNPNYFPARARLIPEAYRQDGTERPGGTAVAIPKSLRRWVRARATGLLGAAEVVE